MNTISYSIGRQYLSHRGMNEALKEILQNFMDYGDYDVSIDYNDNIITISNDFEPDNLEFLALGNSNKSSGSRGKYGEGLKMALLIFSREDKNITITTPDKTLTPFFKNSEIGEVLHLTIENNDNRQKGFSISFELDETTWSNYYNSVIKESDIIFDDNYYGRIVDKEPGEIYCGGLFVNKVGNLSKSYDINVAHLPLTRDRNLPKTFDVNWAASKINESQGKITVEDFTYSDTAYVSKIPKEIKQDIQPRLIGTSIEATYKNEKGEDVVIKNESIKNIVLQDSFFTKTIKKLRNYLIKSVGVYDLLIQFRDKYIYSTEAREEFNAILEELKTK